MSDYFPKDASWVDSCKVGPFDTLGDEDFWGGQVQPLMRQSRVLRFLSGLGVFMNPENKAWSYHPGRFAALLGIADRYSNRFALGPDQSRKERPRRVSETTLRSQTEAGIVWSVYREEASKYLWTKSGFIADPA